MGEQELKLRDLLYLDFDKTASIWSQLDLGLLERVSVTQDSGKDRSAGAKFGVPGLAEANLGVEKRSKFSEEQMVYALRQKEAGTAVEDVCRQLGVSRATFYAWKKKYAHLGVSEFRRLCQLEEGFVRDAG